MHGPLLIYKSPSHWQAVFYCQSVNYFLDFIDSTVEEIPFIWIAYFIIHMLCIKDLTLRNIDCRTLSESLDRSQFDCSCLILDITWSMRFILLLREKVLLVHQSFKVYHFIHSSKNNIFGWVLSFLVSGPAHTYRTGISRSGKTPETAKS